MTNFTTVYELPWLVDCIFRECEKTDVARMDKLENRVIKEIDGFIAKFPDRAKNKPLMMRRVRKHVAGYKARYAQEQYNVFSSIVTKDDEGAEQQYEPVDVLANVEVSVIDAFETKRTIDLLAQADRRKELVLTAWAEGIADATYISDTLASVIGGNAASHRVFIQRFKKHCERALESAV